MPANNIDVSASDILRDYLERNRVIGPGDHNITEWTGKTLGKYLIKDAEYPKFLRYVHDTIFGPDPAACGLLEKHLPNGGPVLIDLDFKYTSGRALQRQFDEDNLHDFVLNYVLALFRFFDLTGLKDLRFFVMLKPDAETAKDKDGNSFHKDGIHIVCPDLVLDPKTQYALRGFVIKKGTISSVFSDTGFRNSEVDVFDESVLHRNNWFLYGASKPDKAWYKLTNVYRISLDTLDLVDKSEAAKTTAIQDALEEEEADDYDTWELMQLLSIRQGKENVMKLPIIEDRQDEWDALYAKWSNGKKEGLKAAAEAQSGAGGAPSGDMTNMIVDGTEFIVDDVSKYALETYTDDDIEQVFELVEKCLIPTKRAKDYGTWVDLGICLYNICPEERMLERWAKFSRRVDGYENTPSNEYEKKWRGFQDRTDIKKIRMGSLHFWAKEDNPLKYKEITERSFIGWVLANPDATHVKTAQLVKRMYQYEFCCTMTGRKMLDYFRYAGNYWQKLKSHNELRSRLTNFVANIYLHAHSEAARLAARMGDVPDKPDPSKKQLTQDEIKEKRNSMLEKGKVLHKSCVYLEGAPFKDNVMKECNEKFYDENFTDMLNQRSDLIACNNCVIELRNYPGNEVIPGELPRVYIRKGRPDDYISFVAGKDGDLEPINMEYDARTGRLTPFDPNTPEQIILNDFFTKVFPNENLRRYVLTLLAACLEGNNREQKFYIMTGGGGNGKSVLINLMRFTFGEYQTSLNTAALTRKRPESGAANPDIITLKSKRFIYMQEPDEGEKLNTARIKQFTGGDIVEARGLFADQEKFKIMGRIFFSTNDLPPVTTMDGGTWRRMEVLPFVSAFKPKGHAEINPAKNVFEMDPNLEDKFKQPSMRAAFLRLLLHYWEERYLKVGLSSPPECVLEAINNYKADNDSFVGFANETLIREQGASATLSEISVAYKKWISEQAGRKPLKAKDIQDRLKRVFKTSNSGKEFMDVRVALEGEDLSGNLVGGGFS